jgi:hypothetical protein
MRRATVLPLPFGDSALDALAPAAEWLPSLVEQVAALRPLQLCWLTPDERFTLAQYHAARWGNCRVREDLNRRRAVPIATQLANLADRFSRDSVKRDILVSEYLSLANRVWQRGGEKPWFRPWDVESELVIVAAL